MSLVVRRQALACLFRLSICVCVVVLLNCYLLLFLLMLSPQYYCTVACKLRDIHAAYTITAMTTFQIEKDGDI